MELQNTTLDDVSAVIGFSATLRLAAWFGDRGNLYIPDKVEDGQLLVKLIGMSAAKKLTEEWGHQHLSIPRIRSYEDDQKKQLVGWLFQRGMGSREIAVQLRMGERRIQQICRELEAAGLIAIVLPKNTGKSPQENEGGPKTPHKNAPQNEGGNLPGAFFKKTGAKR